MKDHFKIKRSKNQLGVYAARNFNKGEKICILRGRRQTPRTLYYHGADFRKAQINPLQIGPKFYLDLYKPYLYFNHSCDPNAVIRSESTLFAMRNIKEGQEITFDYSTTIDESFFCRCGSKKCRGVITDFFALPAKLQKFYIQKKAVPRFIFKKYKFHEENS